jgi:hypothetical protein
MFSTDVITRLMRKFESRLEDCLQCCSCLDGITAALEFAVAEAQGLQAALAEGGEGRGGPGLRLPRLYASRNALGEDPCLEASCQLAAVSFQL